MTPADIRTLPADERITEPGLYRMPIWRHHAQPCDGAAVTSGVLRRMEFHGPSKVWATHILNPDRVEPKDSDALRLGRAMHDVVQWGMEGLAGSFRVLPEDKPRRPTQAQIAAYNEGRPTEKGAESVEFWARVEADRLRGISYVTAEEHARIARMAEALVADQWAPAALAGEPEITMAARDDTTGLWLLARPDVMAFDGVVSDYKTTSGAGRPFDPSHCDRQISVHGYDMQMAFCADVYERIVGERPSDLWLIFQDTEAPHDTVVRALGEEARHWATLRNRRAIDRFAECLSSGRWPGPGEHIGTYEPLPAQIERWQQEQADGRLPHPETEEKVYAAI